jgi:hypothetical protein
VAAPRLDDHGIEATLIDLMAETRTEAKRSFQLAREHTQPGQLVELREIHIGQAARLTRAYAELVMALARHRGKPEQKIVVQYVDRGGQAVGMVNRGE